MAKPKKHLQHPNSAPPTEKWNLTSAICGFACGAEELVAKRDDATCKRCLRNKTLPVAKLRTKIDDDTTVFAVPGGCIVRMTESTYCETTTGDQMSCSVSGVLVPGATIEEFRELYEPSSSGQRSISEDPRIRRLHKAAQRVMEDRSEVPVECSVDDAFEMAVRQIESLNEVAVP